jgi:predicted TIM-barrel fold metal-dependent hydrolase
VPRTVSDPAGGAAATTAPGIVDLDVHHGALDMVEALSPHVSTTYRERLADYGFPLGHGPFAIDGGVRGWREDLLGRPVPAKRPPGGAVAWDVAATSAHLFDRRGVSLAVLTGAAMNGVQSMPDLDYASALCTAFNEWTRETWLAADDRYRVAMSICSQDVEGAVREIDRIGDDPRVCGVLVPTGSARPFGHRTFEPIYDALDRHGLPMLLHHGADGSGVFGELTTGAGTPSHFAEIVVARHAFYEIHMESLVFEAVFERHPNLRVLLLGAGLSWVPSYLWRMDLDWKGLRWHTPWVRTLPSEYVLEHVRFTTGPFAEAPRGERLSQVLGWIEAERTLCFAGGYPQWDADDVGEVADALPDELRSRVMGENARGALRLGT